MPSPAFRINGGAPLAKASLAPGGAIVATLDSTEGVRFVVWEIAGTDETTLPEDYTLTQSGSVGQTVTLTAQAEGTAALLRCTINGGLNLQTDEPDPFAVATAKIFVPTENGLEVGCTGEQYESDRRTGYTGIINQAIRASGGDASQLELRGPYADGVTVGDVVYAGADGFTRCDPLDPSTMPALGVVGALGAASCVVVRLGRVSVEGLTSGGVVFIGLDGRPSSTAPVSRVGLVYVQTIGRADYDDGLFVSVSPVVVGVLPSVDDDDSSPPENDTLGG